MGELKIYAAVFGVSVRNMVHYRANIILDWLLGMFALIAPFAFWKTAYVWQTQISGYGMADMLTYTVLASLLGRFLVYDGIQQGISRDIRDGKLSQFLCRPINYKAYTFFYTIGKKGMNFIAIFFLYTLVIALYVLWNLLHGGFPQTEFFRFSAVGSQWALFFCSMLSGILISFFLYYILGLVAFWMLECSALYVALGTLFYFLAGGLFPLDLFPAIGLMSKFLPFQYQLFFPIKVFQGGLDRPDLLNGIAVQVFWCAALWGLSVIIWKCGIKKYTSVGN